jgi:type VI protein secretion system component Hcp
MFHSPFKTNFMRKSIYFLFAVALILTCSSAFSQSIVVMKAMNGTTKLNGGSTVAGHAGEIDVLSNSLGETRCATCNVSQVSDFNVMISLSAATISLKKLLLNGTKLTSIDVVYMKSGATPFTYYKMHMEDVTVTNVQESASSESPTFSASFTPSRIAWLQIAQKPDGSTGTKTSYGWDVTNNAEWLFVF